MPYTQAQNRATQKYNAKAYDQIKILVKKGERERYKKRAKELGKTLNAYFLDLAEQDMRYCK